MSRRFADDRGQAGGAEMLALGFLVFIAGTLLLANAWAVVDARLAVGSAAREAARAYVEADDGPTAAAMAAARANETLAAFGRSGAAAVVHPPEIRGGFARCARVSVTVDYVVPALEIAFIGGFGHGLTVSATHTELVDPFRDGPSGTAAC